VRSTRGLPLTFGTPVDSLAVAVGCTIHPWATEKVTFQAKRVYIQRLMGHSSVKTTPVYLHVTRKDLTKIVSPIDLLELPEKPTTSSGSGCHESSL
jgi:hypothetical protein